MSKAHALLSPSSAHRWMNCAAAPRLEERVPDTGSDFAREGTLAHAYCAMKLHSFLGFEVTDEAIEIAELEKQYHTEEMDGYSDMYVTAVLEAFNAARAKVSDAKLLVEVRLDFSRWIRDAFGTSDAIIIADGMMTVFDFKYGKGVPVSAVRNEQMMIYALGAYEKFSFDYRIECVRMVIVQPRLDNYSEYEMTVSELLKWAENELKPRAAAAWSGEGEAVPGGWCRFCKVRNTCRALTDYCIAAPADAPDPMLLSPQELAADALPRLDIIRTWLSGVEDYALQQALSGVTLPGWKVVEGRSVRRITDQAGAAEALNAAGYTDEQIYRPKELQSITELEKLTGRKNFAAICGKCVTKPQGKPTLVPESDRRPPMNSAEVDFKDIQINN